MRYALKRLSSDVWPVTHTLMMRILQLAIREGYLQFGQTSMYHHSGPLPCHDSAPQHGAYMIGLEEVQKKD